MANQMMWTYMAKLGSNMWAKKGSQRPYFVEEEFKYHEEVFCNRNTWKKLMEALPACGINTVLIDVGEAIRLESHPELAIPGSWDKDELRDELKRIRKLGLTPIPKLNFSTSHNAWMQDYSYMVGSDLYYKVCEEILLEVMEVFDYPEFFHLGLDEEFLVAQKHNPVRTIRAPYKFIEDCNKLYKICLDHGVRPWIWLNYESVQTWGGPGEISKCIPKDVLISSAFYSFLYGTAPDPAGGEFYRQIDEWGYEQIPCSSPCEHPVSMRQTMRYCKEYLDPNRLKGYLMAPWLHTTEEFYYGLMHGARLFGYAKDLIYPGELPLVEKEPGI